MSRMRCSAKVLFTLSIAPFGSLLCCPARTQIHWKENRRRQNNFKCTHTHVQYQVIPTTEIEWSYQICTMSECVYSMLLEIEYTLMIWFDLFETKEFLQSFISIKYVYSSGTPFRSLACLVTLSLSLRILPRFSVCQSVSKSGWCVSVALFAIYLFFCLKKKNGIHSNNLRHNVILSHFCWVNEWHTNTN